MKKPRTWPVILGVIGAFVAVGWLLHASLGSSMQNDKLSMDGTLTVGVPALATDPASYRGELRVEGIVAQVNPEKHLFLLADLHCRKKILAGNDAGCMAVPVHWKGSMPALHGDVEAEGVVKGSHQEHIFVAEAVRNFSPTATSAGAR